MALLWQEIVVAILIIVLLLVQIVVKNHERILLKIALAGLTTLLLGQCFLAVETTASFFFSMAVESPLVRQFGMLLTSGVLLTILLGVVFPAAPVRSEYYVLLCGVLLGLLLLARAQHFALLLIALETVSICSYGLVFFTADKQAIEAGVKYVLFGIFSSALMLYGISLWWNVSGSLNGLQHVPEGIPAWSIELIFLLILTGLLFKTSAVPFHIWTPDVLQGAHLPVAAFLTVVPKVGALAAIAILYQPQMDNVLGVSALATLLLGTLTAIWQTNMRRLMAYSAIAQAGFLLAAIIAQNTEALIYYLWAYLLMNFLAFAVMAWKERQTNSQQIKTFAGTGLAVPLAGIAMLVAMAGFIGLPPTAGFAAKLVVFSALWQKWQQTQAPLLLFLFVLGFVATVVSVYFYLQVPFQMFFRKGMRVRQLSVLQQIWLLLLSLAIIGLLLFNL